MSVNNVIFLFDIYMFRLENDIKFLFCCSLILFN